MKHKSNALSSASTDQLKYFTYHLLITKHKKHGHTEKMNNGHIKEEKRVDVKERDLTMLKRQNNSLR
jgi:hypothetical protein